MEICCSEKGAFSCLAFKGRLDATSSPSAEEAFAKSIEKNPKTLVDLSSLEYISSAGLRVLLVAAKRSQQKAGRIAIFGLTDNVREVFEISGFSALFRIFDTEAEAIVFLSE